MARQQTGQEFFGRLSSDAQGASLLQSGKLGVGLPCCNIAVTFRLPAHLRERRRCAAEGLPCWGRSGEMPAVRRRGTLADNRSIEISCEEVWRELSNYIDNGIDPDLRTRMQQHFQACAHCTAILDGTNNVIRLVGDGRSFPLPAGFSDRLRQRLSGRGTGDDTLDSKER